MLKLIIIYYIKCDYNINSFYIYFTLLYKTTNVVGSLTIYLEYQRFE